MIRLLMTTESVAEVLDCTPDNVRALARSGALTPVKVRGSLYEMSEVSSVRAIRALQPNKMGRPPMTPLERKAKARALRLAKASSKR